MTEGVQGDKAGSKSPEDATAVIQTHKGTLQHPLTPHAVLAFFTELNLTHSPHAVIFILQNQCPVAYPRPHPCEHPSAGQSDTRCSCPQQPPTHLFLPFQLSIPVQNRGGWLSDISQFNARCCCHDLSSTLTFMLSQKHSSSLTSTYDRQYAWPPAWVHFCALSPHQTMCSMKTEMAYVFLNRCYLQPLKSAWHKNIPCLCKTPTSGETGWRIQGNFPSYLVTPL